MIVALSALPDFGWLIRTLWVTSALIALVLVLRRPVARHFGAGPAYALWLLPVTRLFLPPLTLPASLAPQLAAPANGSETIQTFALQGVPEAPAIDWWAVATAVWLGGALLVLGWRIGCYFVMRRTLLRNSVEIERRGRVRIVESPAVGGPLAFGLIDPVVALPVELTDPRVREVALAHELAHHRGHDLAMIFAFQVLLALHWCDPLAWIGWRAMRRDQEAACDARVVGRSVPAERAAYARVIADFAIAPRLSSTSLACPMRAERAIIHRLRSLSMTPISRRRARSAQFALAGAIALALPITATITYAGNNVPPETPAAPAMPEAATPQIYTVTQTGEQGRPDHVRTITRDNRTIMVRSNKPISDADLEAAISTEPATPLPPAPPVSALPPAPPVPPVPFAGGIMPPMPPVPPQFVGRTMTIDTTVDKHCTNPMTKVAETYQGQRVVVRVCAGSWGKAARDMAAVAIRQARTRIAANDNMPAETRANVLRELDEELADLDNDG